ncbi:uncharacterized protein LOC135942938 [Cloeon dipterum]|uniref:uncharacterized protein LOC135942938 n=1 Tax=Cloeon dipterum TaxID=197152 RepID=UPI00321FFF66
MEYNILVASLSETEKAVADMERSENANALDSPAMSGVAPLSDSMSDYSFETPTMMPPEVLESNGQQLLPEQVAEPVDGEDQRTESLATHGKDQQQSCPEQLAKAAGSEHQPTESVAADDTEQVSEGEIVDCSENESNENEIVECSQTDSSEKPGSRASRSTTRSSASTRTTRSSSSSPETPRDQPARQPLRKKPISLCARRLDKPDCDKQRPRKPAAKAPAKPAKDDEAEAELTTLGERPDLPPLSPSYQRKILGDGEEESFPEKDPLSAEDIRKEIRTVIATRHIVQQQYEEDRRSAETTYHQVAKNINTTITVNGTRKANKIAANIEKKAKLEAQEADIASKRMLLEEAEKQQLQLEESMKEVKSRANAIQQQIRDLEKEKNEPQFVSEDTTVFDEIIEAKGKELVEVTTTLNDALKAFGEKRADAVDTLASKLKFLKEALQQRVQLEEAARKRPSTGAPSKIPSKKQARIVILPEASTSSAAGGTGIIGRKISYARMDVAERPRKTYTLLSEKTAVYNCVRAVGQIKFANIVKADDRKLKERMHALRNKIHGFEQKMAKIFLGEKTARNQLLLDKKSIAVLERIINGEIQAGEKYYPEKESIVLNYDNHMNVSIL